MYRCKVLTGTFTKGKSDFIEPPIKDVVEETYYHSVVDNIESPNMFVIFHDNQAYPEYLITFDHYKKA